MTTTDTELKEGLTLHTTVNDDGTKELSFTNSTVDKQFICKYGFKGATPEALGITRIEGEKWIVSVHPEETQPFVKGEWKGNTKSIATGPCDKAWLEKKAGAAKDSNARELEKVQEIMKAAGMKTTATSAKVAELCEKEGVLFVDTNFLPLDCSMQAPWQKGEMKMFPFKRPSQWELLKDAGLKPELFVDKIEPSDINQGSLADCYLMGSLGSLAQKEEYVRRIFSGKQNAELGIYRLKMCKGQWWEDVVVDDFLPCSGPKPAFARNRDEPNELWVALVEKAYSKLNGSYFAMKTGQCAAALADLTGMPHKTTAVSEDLWTTVLSDFNDGIMQVFGTPGKNLMYVEEAKQSEEDKKMWEEYRAQELICEHSYSVLRAVETKSGKRMILLRNPWGHTTHGLWKGKYAADDKAWTAAFKEEVGYTEGDGLFYMEWADAAKWFSSLSSCYTYKTWDSIRVKGSWTASVPSVCMELDIKKKTKVWLGLHQSDTRGIKPGSSPDAAYTYMNLYIVTMKKDGVKVVESFGTQKRDRFGLLELDPEENAKLFILGVPRESDVNKNFVVTFLAEDVSAFTMFFNTPAAGTKHYASAKDVVLADWSSGEVQHQLSGPNLSKAAVATKKAKQVGTGEPASRDYVSKKKKKEVAVVDGEAPPSKPEGGAKKAKIRSGSAGAAPAKVRSGSAGAPPAKVAASASPAKANLRSKTSAAGAKAAPAAAASETPAGNSTPLKSAVKKAATGTITVEVKLISATNLISKGSMNPFCELKLRGVSGGVVGSDHSNPQKQASKVQNKTLSPTWNETFTFNLPVQDALRVSIFGKKMMGKDYMGRVDLMGTQLAEDLEKGQPAITKTYQELGLRVL